MFPTGFPQPRAKSGQSGNGWLKLADVTLAADQPANALITFAGLSDYRVIKIVFSARSTSTAEFLQVRINNDSGAKYAQSTLTGGSTTTGVNLTSIPLATAAGVVTAVHNEGTIELINESNKVKNIIALYTNTGANAGVAPTALKVHGVYHDIVSSADSISVFTTTNPIQAGSRFTAYGLK